MIIFVGGTHLSRPYKGTMLVACAMDANNHQFNFAYVILSTEREPLSNDKVVSV